MREGSFRAKDKEYKIVKRRKPLTRYDRSTVLLERKARSTLKETLKYDTIRDIYRLNLLDRHY